MTVPLAAARAQPPWRGPLALLFVMAAAMPLAFATWSVLLNNFVVEVAAFDGADIGLLHTVREVPGFLAITVIAMLLVVREQTLALASLVLLGAATALTAEFPTMGGILVITLLSSIGFHVFETVNTSLQLQWLPKDRAPRLLGLLIAVGSLATLAAYGAVMWAGGRLGLGFAPVYWAAGGATAALALGAWMLFPRFEAPTPQTKRLVLRRRYWLYYALQFLAGARRQIFVVFAGFMMVERFGLAVHEVAGLFVATLVVSAACAPLIGRLVERWGEARALAIEYAGLVVVFSAYAGVYAFGWGVAVAAALYVVDHVFFALALALKTYLQKIADPADIAPTAAVAFTINHVAAVTLPVPLGLLWLASPGAVFGLAALIAATSLGLALLIPRHPAPGHETRLGGLVAAPAQ